VNIQVDMNLKRICAKRRNAFSRRLDICPDYVAPFFFIARNSICQAILLFPNDQVTPPAIALVLLHPAIALVFLYRSMTRLFI
jgi:hypothetical protein